MSGRGPDVVVFDDDPVAAELIAALVQEAGCSCEKFLDGAGAVEKVRALRPRVVVLDLLLPGLDGFGICRALKSQPDTSPIPIIVVSGKPFREDREKALGCGACAYLTKPLDVAKFHDVFLGALGPAGPSAGDGPRAARSEVFSARIWGCRSGGGPEPTCCLGVDLGERLIILDAGSGLEALCAEPRSLPPDILLLLTHYHAGHVEGLKHLARILAPGRRLRIGGPADTDATLRRLALEALPQAARGQAQLFALGESRFQAWPDTAVGSLLTRHPGATLAFRIDCRGRSLVYCPDNETETGEETRTDFPEKIARFVRGADVLVHDARYSDEDYPSNACRGHGCPQMALDLACTEGVRRLVLFHLDARYGPADMERMLALSQERLRANFSTMSLDIAVPGMILGV